MSWSIVNVVATADLKQRVDIQEIATLPYTIHDSEIYGGRVTYLKTPEMNGKVTIFPSGKLISVGTKSPEQAQQDLETTVSILATEELIEYIELEANIRNIVVLYKTEVNDLEYVSEMIGGIYEPEQFPAIIYKPDEIDVTYLIFNSGKIIISGIKSEKQIQEAISHIDTSLRENDLL